MKLKIFLVIVVLALVLGGIRIFEGAAEPSKVEEIRAVALEKTLPLGETLVQLSPKSCQNCATETEKKLAKLPFIDTGKYKNGLNWDDAKHQLIIALKANSGFDAAALFKSLKSAGYEPKGLYLTLKGDQESKNFLVFWKDDYLNKSFELAGSLPYILKQKATATLDAYMTANMMENADSDAPKVEVLRVEN